uniref:Retrotransposon gag domain-containing protein n=1 Tax=Musa acuminata subsp. malaccensis TaxID=214687 RepID=A0A804JXD3_MUSAM|nr:PREDICTED: uncharacterized protein LOC103992242 [Musa acuminata subsp. malaccensis]
METIPEISGPITRGAHGRNATGNAPHAPAPVNAQDDVHGVLNAIRGYFERQEERDEIPRGRNNTLDHFKRLGPPIFEGKPDPIFAERWIRQVEKTFKAIECRENQKVPFASFILEGKADTWWTSKRRMLEAGGNVVTWEQFKDAFYEQFFPDSVRFEKQQEFLSIRQGNRTVMEYDHHFTELAQFSPYIAFNESQRARHFERGLRSSIRKSVAVLILPTYAEVLNRALVVEKLDNELQQAKNRKRPFSAAPFTYGGSHSGPSKKGKGKQQIMFPPHAPWDNAYVFIVNNRGTCRRIAHGSNINTELHPKKLNNNSYDLERKDRQESMH